MAGCYKSLSERPVIERMIVWGELARQYVEGRTIPAGSGLYDMRRILDGNLTRPSSYASGDLYTTINYCNTLLSYAPEVEKWMPTFSKGLKFGHRRSYNFACIGLFLFGQSVQRYSVNS